MATNRFLPSLGRRKGRAQKELLDGEMQQLEAYGIEEISFLVKVVRETSLLFGLSPYKGDVAAVNLKQASFAENLRNELMVCAFTAIMFVSSHCLVDFLMIFFTLFFIYIFLNCSYFKYIKILSKTTFIYY